MFFAARISKPTGWRTWRWIAGLWIGERCGRRGIFGAAVKVVAGAAAPAAKAPTLAAKSLRGLVKSGVVHLLEGELPEGIFVRVTPEV